MKKVKILIWTWFKWTYWNEVLKKVEKTWNIVCKDRLEFEFKPEYNSQNDFDRVLKEYNPDLIFIWDKTCRDLEITIPNDIKVITYCDHFLDQFTIYGRNYFEKLLENNYLYLPILDANRIDVDDVLNNEIIRRKIYFAPFVASLRKEKIEDIYDKNKYCCELSIVSHYKDIEYYYWFFSIKQNSVSGQNLMWFIGEILFVIRKQLQEYGKIDLDIDRIGKIVSNIFEKVKMNLYVRNKEKFISYWINAIKYNIFPHEYEHFIVDGLIERGYDIKLVGAGWEKIKKYRKYAFGQIEEGSDELCRIYKSSKINVGTNVYMGIHRRNIEVIENDCLCFQAELTDEGLMYSDYHHYFKDAEDIVIYRNKEELYEKVDFYLSHEKERKQVIESGKRTVKQFLQAEDIVGKAIMEIYNR